MREVLETGESVASDEKFSRAGAVAANVVVESPFKVKAGDGLRSRRGWHQTWKREDEVDQAKVWGYVNIRECAKDKEGNTVKEEAGKETGPVLKRLELGMRETFEYAMEVDEKLYLQDIEAMARQGQALINQSGVRFREVVDNLNSSAGKRGGVASVTEDTGYEEQAEEPVVMGRGKKVS